MGNYHVRFRGRVRNASFGGVPSLPDRSRLAQSPYAAATLRNPPSNISGMNRSS